MEASALPASVGLARPRLAFGASLLRIRSDDQLVTLFREGSEDAFRVIHDRYRSRLHAYTRQMLTGSPHDSEDALQEIFLRAYSGLRANQRDLALRPWLYRVAHNRCVDELRRQPLIVLDPADACLPAQLDPAARVEQREALRRLIADVQRLPEQQRSALLMRELSGMTYQHVADALGVSVPAVKSLLVRARVGLAQAGEARDTSCALIREELILAHDRGVRASSLARRHLSDCPSCREFRTKLRGVSRQLAALAPTLGPLGVIANLLGWGGGGGAAAGGSAAGGSAAAAGGVGAAASAGLLAGSAGHVVTLLAAAVVTAGGAVEIQKTIIAPAAHHARHHAARDADASTAGAAVTPAVATAAGGGLSGSPATSVAAGAAGVASAAAGPSAGNPTAGGHGTAPVVLTQILDPDHMLYRHLTLSGGIPPVAGSGAPAPAGATTGAPPGTGTPAPGPASPPIVPGAGTPAAPLPGDAGIPSAYPPGTLPAGTAPAGATGPTTPGGSSSATPAPGADSTPSGLTSSSTAPAAGSSPSGQVSAGASPSGASSRSGSVPATPGSTAAGTSGTGLTRTGSTVAKTVAAGGAISGRVVTFVVTRGHGSHRFALGTLLPR